MVETDPFRLRVLNALTTSLEGITVADGYKHDLADAVFRGRMSFGEGDPVPMLSILEDPEPIEQFRGAEDSTQRGGPWSLIIQGFCIDDKKNPTDPALRLAADVESALSKEKLKLRGGGHILGIKAITSLTIGRAVCRPPDENSSHAYFWLNLTIGLSENLALPYGA